MLASYARKGRPKVCKLCSLHVHSEYSNIDGVSKLIENIERAKDLGMEAIGLTDHGVIAGHLEFDKLARKNDIKPIFGCEMYHGVRMGETFKGRDQAHLIVLAKTDEGLKNLWRLSDRASREDHAHFVDRVNWDDLKEFREGLIVTSACPLGLVAKGILKGDYSAFNKYLDIFGDNFYVELTTYPGDALFEDKDSDEPVTPRQLNEALVDLANERGVPLVYGDDGHYAKPELFAAHDAYVARGTGQTIDTPISERKMYHPEGALVIKSLEDVQSALSYLPQSIIDECLSNSVEIARSVDAHLPEIRRHLPVFIPGESPWVPEGVYGDAQAAELFVDLVEEGMERCYGENPGKIVEDQTFYETETFLNSGLHHYFLVGWDLMQFTDHEEIERGPGRGSSAGCIVARELGITDIDPLKYDLSFERFWNPGRAEGFPDIDSDFQQSSRGKIKHYLSDRYGQARVRSIGTVTRMKPKDLVGKFAGACGVTRDEENALKKLIDDVPDIEILGVDQIGWDEEHDPGKVVYVMHSTKETKHDVGERILAWVEDQPKHRQEVLVRFLDLCSVLCNRIAGYGVHPSGVVISDVDLEDELPCRFSYSATTRYPVTQFAMDDVDKRQFVKLDILGLKTLDILANWKRQMKENHDFEVDWSQLEWDDDIDHIGVWRQLADGLSAGAFQVEDGYAKRLGKDFKPESVSDGSIIVALNRPGPIRSGTPDKFIRRRRGEEKTTFPHPILEDILDETFGEFLYQEGVIRFFVALGYSPSDADAVRKILGKKQPEKWDALYKGTGEWEGKSYVQACKNKHIDESTASRIWALIVNFAKYSFNKAHSVAYGTILFRTLFAKFYGHPEQLAACIAEVPDAKKAERIPMYIGEARRVGITVHPPDIEHSDWGVRVRDGNIYLGFSNVKGVKENAAKYLVAMRDEWDPEDPVDISTPERLAEYLDKASKARTKENAKRKKEGFAPLEGKSPKQKLTSGQITALYTAGCWERLEGFKTPLRELQAREKEMLQVIVTDDTDEIFARNQEELEECDSYEEALVEYTEDTVYTLPGVIQGVRPVKTKKDKKDMGIITMEFEGSSIDFAVFPNEWNTHSFMWREKTCGIFEIRHSINKQNGQIGYNFRNGFKIA